MNFLEQMRKQKGFTIKELSEKSGISSVEISHIENNKYKPRITTLSKLARALEIDLEELYQNFN